MSRTQASSAYYILEWFVTFTTKAKALGAVELCLKLLKYWKTFYNNLIFAGLYVTITQQKKKKKKEKEKMGHIIFFWCIQILLERIKQF